MSVKFKVVTDSMAPLISIGDELLYKKSNTYHTFDIILFARHSKLVTHFVWRNQLDFNKSIITRSLKDFYTDEEPVLESEILGVVENFKISIFTRIKIIYLCWINKKL